MDARFELARSYSKQGKLEQAGKRNSKKFARKTRHVTMYFWNWPLFLMPLKKQMRRSSWENNTLPNILAALKGLKS